MSTRFTHQKVFIIPIDAMEQANALLERQGYGPDMFSVQLKEIDGEEPTNAACSVIADDGMLATVRKVCETVDPTYIETEDAFEDAIDSEGLEKVPSEDNPL